MLERLPTYPVFLAVVLRLQPEIGASSPVYCLMVPPTAAPPFVLVADGRDEPERTKSQTSFVTDVGIEIHYGDGDSVQFMALRDRICALMTGAPLEIADPAWRQLSSFPVFRNSTVEAAFDGEVMDLISRLEFQVRTSPR